MEITDIAGGDAENFAFFPRSLNPGIINAVCHIISNSTGKSLEIPNGSEALPEEEADPGQLAMAVAYTNLCLEDPEMVTSSHLKMLRNNFSYEQIQELNTFLRNIL